jgi:hypothetical protein
VGEGKRESVIIKETSGSRVEGRGIVEWLSPRPRLRPAQIRKEYTGVGNENQDDRLSYSSIPASFNVYK